MDELYFYLHCRFVVLGGKSSDCCGNSFSFCQNIELLKAEKAVETILKKYDSINQILVQK